MLTLFFAALLTQEVGRPLPVWTPGTLDIHQINTGRGNSALLIFPDGTSMLIDAGGLSAQSNRLTMPKPDASRPPGEWIARYAQRMLPAPAAFDYALLTHFHDDHMSAFPDVGARVPIKLMLDRGWPAYDYPAPLNDGLVKAYRKFLNERNVAVQKLQPGRNDQIVLTHDAGKYPNFEVRNIASNGEVWTGVGTNTRAYHPRIADLKPDEYPTENMCSNVIRVSYGKFDFYSGGDIPGVRRETFPVWNDMETPVAEAVGPVEVALVNHHANRDSQNAFFVSMLRPQVFLMSVWSSDHPGHDVLERMLSERLYPGPRDVFATNMLDVNRAVIGPMLDRLKSAQGHIVVRVAPGGGQFKVVVVDDSAESYKVKTVHGPYQSR